MAKKPGKTKKKFDLGIYADHFLFPGVEGVAVKEALFLGVKGGKIASIEPWRPALKAQCKEFIDGKDKVCLPSFVNGHTHLPMTLFRGIEDDVPFHVWLFERILPLEGALVSEDFVRTGTELAALECIRFGVSTVNEMYFFAEATADVLDKAGLRAIVSQTMAKFPLPEDKALGADKFKIFRRARKKYAKHSRIEIGLGPHAPYSCEDSLLKAVQAEAEATGAPVHIHLSETKKEVDDSLKECGMTPVGRLAKLGVLKPRTICAHCVHLDERDQTVFAQSGASVVYNPDSNMKLGSGVAKIVEYLKKNIPVAIGTDGAASNNDLSIYGAMDLGTKLQKLTHGDSAAMTAAQALYMATLGGAQALGLGTVTGSLEVGKAADFQLVDLRFPHLQPVNSLVSHLVYSASGLEVDTLVCEGRVLMKNKKILVLNEKKVYARAAAWKKTIAKELGK